MYRLQLVATDKNSSSGESQSVSFSRVPFDLQMPKLILYVRLCVSRLGKQLIRLSTKNFPVLFGCKVSLLVIGQQVIDHE